MDINDKEIKEEFDKLEREGIVLSEEERKEIINFFYQFGNIAYDCFKRQLKDK